MLEEIFDKESAEALAYYIEPPTQIKKEDVQKTIERAYNDGVFSPYLAACNIIHIDHIGNPELFIGIAKIIMCAVTEGKITELLISLYELSFISALSLDTRSSMIAWIFSNREHLTDEVLKICRSPFFFPSDASAMVIQLIKMEMYDEAVEFSIENEGEHLRYLLASELPIEYMAHLMDSPASVMEVIDERLQNES